MKNGFLFLSALVLIGCGGSSSKTPETKPTPSNDITLYTTLSGKGSIIPTQITVKKGESVNFELTPEQGYNLANVSGCNGKINGQNYQVKNVTEKCTVSVEFTAKQYLISTKADLQGKVVVEQPEISHGETTFADIFPHTDYDIGDVFGCNGQLTGTRYNTGKIHGDCRINVAFTPMHPEPEAPITRVRIPVVVHVFENGIYGVTDEQIKAQIAQTNLHYRMQNTSELNSINADTKQYVGDTGIQFYLADTDPNGNPHSGIIRIDGHKGVGDNQNYSFARPELGGSAPWQNDKYINIWVSSGRNMSGGVAPLGWAYVPTFAPDDYIGVTVAQETFGPNNTEFPYFEGKTLSHELGHFLGLMGHTNNDVDHKDNNHANQPCDADIASNCQNKNISHSNFMQMNNADNTMKMFSKGQVSIMRNWLENGPLEALYLNNLE
ncbi:M43 family zinc metalloprotease [Thalassotalea marina]|uniref:Peptidase M43 pregnancy-associated plasma-A domain-containing protein n=1 Tax=Thalassotalea marina TaxID=1673741 RepID=A0A919EKR8_9GAMM|nr:M43 family zinc metalloprotease [Thalassotalea marina]GHF96052.1 hypothetical protein GCM10017161_25480 [Thalassotalea marina]